MTVSVQQSSELVLGDGTTTVFDFSYVGAIAADNEVTWTQADGTITVLDPSQYTLVLNAAVPGQIWGIGGTVTFPLAGSPMATGDTLLIQRVLPYTQETSISNQGAFYPEAVEAALDILCFEIQQLHTLIQFGTSSSSAGNVVGPGTSSNYGVAYFIGTNGQRLGSTAVPTAGYILTGRGPTQPANFQLPPGQANGILGPPVIYTPGDYTITPPDGATIAFITLQGGGGGGEGAAGNPGAGKVSVGSGGSGGGFLQVYVTASDIAGQALHVGDQGLGGAAGNNDGADGDDTTILTYAAFGGLGGILGTTSSTPPYAAHSMAGGLTSGSSLATDRPGGPSGNELTTSTSAAFGGSGGSSQLSPGTAAATCTTNAQTNGANATGFGGGGGGGVASGSGTSASGGNGSSGSATIIYYGFQSATASAVGEATQAQEEAGILGTVYTSPRNQQWHDSALKAQGYVLADGTADAGIYNATSAKDSSGHYTITFINAMASSSYSVTCNGIAGSGGSPFAHAAPYELTTTSFKVVTAVGLGSPTVQDNDFTFKVAGRAAEASGYVASAVHFGNTASSASVYITMSTFSGVADSPFGVFSCWVKQNMASQSGNFPTIFSSFQSTSDITGITLDSTNTASVAFATADATHGVEADSPVSSFPDDTWVNLLVSWDTAHATGSKIMQIYQNGVSTGPTISDPNPSFNVRYSTFAGWSFGERYDPDFPASGDNSYFGDMADLQFYVPASFLDLSITASQRLFITAAGKPEDPSVATAALGAPVVLLAGDAAGFPVNQGSGGAVTLIGVLTNASTSPSD